MIKQIIHWLLGSFLKRQSKVRREIQTHNISTARSVGIIYSVNEEGAQTTVKEFAEKLAKQNISVDNLGYANDRKSEGAIGYSVFNKKNVNFFQKPNSSIVSSFLSKPYDILIYACASQVVPLQYISAESPAHFKIGPYISEYIDCFDFMIQVEPGTSLESYLKKVDFYLHNLNKNAA